MLDFKRQEVKIVHLNPRCELHGTEEHIAVDIKLLFELRADTLDALSSSLYPSLFEVSNDPDMFEGKDAPLLVHVRHAGLGTLRWSETWRAMRLNLHTGAKPKDDLVFDGVTVDRLTMRPREGGTVAFSARAQVHPRTENVTARLVALLKHEIPATLDASEASNGSEADDA
ncbi:conserved hypothetical protein [Burkholderia diffusa]|uniref:hypothetical protein n=1 Tax=Burkholderia diffusa TaxID=488732 RepID=UPI001CB0339E|nr:hypothetical protein [Burkholderia diffusa]CAG9265701.1 conserved hypothetical protein [Burkholderia diffusa]